MVAFTINEFSRGEIKSRRWRFVVIQEGRIEFGPIEEGGVLSLQIMQISTGKTTSKPSVIQVAEVASGRTEPAVAMSCQGRSSMASESMSLTASNRANRHRLVQLTEGFVAPVMYRIHEIEEGDRRRRKGSSST